MKSKVMFSGEVTLQAIALLAISEYSDGELGKDHSVNDIVMKALERYDRIVATAIPNIVTKSFAHYISEHTNGEADVVAVTEFYNVLQEVLRVQEEGENSGK